LLSFPFLASLTSGSLQAGTALPATARSLRHYCNSRQRGRYGPTYPRFAFELGFGSLTARSKRRLRSVLTSAFGLGEGAPPALTSSRLVEADGDEAIHRDVRDCLCSSVGPQDLQVDRRCVVAEAEVQN